MSIKCPHCGRGLTIPDGVTTGQGKCSQCNQTFDLAKAERIGLSPGTILGGCRIDGLLGRGGMATVYRATQLSLDRPVAIKVLAPQLARRQRFVERFEREAAALAQLSHPGIVNILDRGVADDTYYLVMEFVEGESLRARLRREGKLPLADATALLGQVAAGLDYAHGRGVLHRDIKPENILIGSDGGAKLADFGIARMLGDDAPDQLRLTTASTRMGTAHYMAPEQMRDAAVADHRADIYALGVLLYEMLAGELPIGQFKPASRVADGVPPAVDRLISRALAATPEERFQSVAELRAAMETAVLPEAVTRTQEPRPRLPLRRRPSSAPLVAAGVFGVLLFAFFAIWLAHRRPEPRPEAVVAPPPTTASAAARPEPAEADTREKAATDLFSLASRRAALGDWRAAKDHISRLDKEFAATRFYAANRADIDALRARAEAELRPKAESRPEPEPWPPRKQRPWPRPERAPEPEPPPKQETAVAPPARALELYVKAAKALQPLWSKRQYADAAAKAKQLAADKDYAAAPDAPKWLAEDAEALVAFWRAVEAGAASLKPGEAISIAGIKGEFEKLNGPSIHIRSQDVGFAKKLIEIHDDELVSLARRAGEPTSARDHVALALFWLCAAKLDPATVRAELALAEKAGADASRHRALLDATLPPKEPEPKVAAPKKEAPAPKKTPFVLIVSASVDRVWDLVITPDGVHWEQGVGGLARLFDPGPRPRTGTVLNGRIWHPRWNGNVSNTEPVPRLPNSFVGMTCTVTLRKGEGRVFLAESADERFVVRFAGWRRRSDDCEAEIVIAPGSPSAAKQPPPSLPPPPPPPPPGRGPG